MVVNEVFPIFNTVWSIYTVTERTLVPIVNVCIFFFIFVIPDYGYISVVFDWVVETWVQDVFIVLQLKLHEEKKARVQKIHYKLTGFPFILAPWF